MKHYVLPMQPTILYRIALCLLIAALALVGGVCRLRWEQQQWRIEELQNRLYAQQRARDLDGQYIYDLEAHLRIHEEREGRLRLSKPAVVMTVEEYQRTHPPVSQPLLKRSPFQVPPGNRRNFLAEMP